MSNYKEDLSVSLPEGTATWAKYKDVLNEAAQDTDGLGKKLKSLGDVVRAMGPQFAELGQAIEGATNPALLVTMAAVAGMDKVFEHVQKLQDQFHSLVAEGQRINGMISDLIDARPTATQSYIELTDQLARLHEHPDRSSITDEQSNAVFRGADQNAADAAPEGQKPVFERALIAHEIARIRTNLEQDLAKGTDIDTAQKKVDETRNAENDLKRQMEQLSGVIAALKENAVKAKAAGDGTGWVPFKDKDYRLRDDQNDQAAALQAQLDRATAAFPAAAKAAADAENNFNNTRHNVEIITGLGDRLTTLNNTLGTFDNSRDGKKLKDQIQAIINWNRGTGDSIREMGDKLHLSQQQLADLATRIITQHSDFQKTLTELHQQLDAQARQIAALQIPTGDLSWRPEIGAAGFQDFLSMKAYVQHYPSCGTRHVDHGNLWEISMRELIFLFSIVLMTACGCGKSTPSQAPAGTPAGSSNQSASEAPAQATNRMTLAELSQNPDYDFLRPDPNRKYVNVDVVIHNCLTNDCMFVFESGIDFEIQAKIYSAGESVTNPDVSWGSWPSIKLGFNEEGNGLVHFLELPMDKINDQLATGKYHQLLFQITGSDTVGVSCE